MLVFEFDDLAEAPLVLDALYKGGTDYSKVAGNDPLHKLLPKCSNMGGFRPIKRDDQQNNYAYVVIYSSNREPDWPDYLNTSTGTYTYYGDNRKPGQVLLATKGNRFLKSIFSMLDTKESRENIPPVLVFQKATNGRDVYFKGLAKPGSNTLLKGQELVVKEFEKGNEKFQNYVACFTILETDQNQIPKDWLRSLISSHIGSQLLAPQAWLDFINHGNECNEAFDFGKPHNNPKLSADDMSMITALEKVRAESKRDFTCVACSILRLLDANVYEFYPLEDLTTCESDIAGSVRIGTDRTPIIFNFRMRVNSAKYDSCSQLDEIKNLTAKTNGNDFFVYFTTCSAIDGPDKTIRRDDNRIMLICAEDIVRMLHEKGINSANIDLWIRKRRK